MVTIDKFLDLLPIKSRSKNGDSGSEAGSNWDESSDTSDTAKRQPKAKPDIDDKPSVEAKQPIAKTPKKKVNNLCNNANVTHHV